jgi:hypothetical protein
MTIVPVMWAVWAALVLLFAALHLYRGRMGRDEEDQIFLTDSFSHEQAEQALIHQRVGKIQPAIRASMYLAGAATLFLIGYYALDIYRQFK